ncbi:MAG: dockerin type I domain-containing protein [bacterium]
MHETRSLLLIYVALLFLPQIVISQSLPGDINGDSKVDSTDIARGVQIALGKLPPATQNEIAAGDMNRDGCITVQDLVFIRNTIAGVNRPPVADASASPDSGLAGTNIQLDATRSFDLDGDTLTYRWRQLHMNRYSTEYMTENEAILSDSTSATPTFNPEWPGNYRFELQLKEPTSITDLDTVDVLVSKVGVRHFDAEGLIFYDVFGELGGPHFDVTPDNSDSLAAVQNRAMDAAMRIGAGWIGVVPAAFYQRIAPLPQIKPENNSISLTNEKDYAAIVASAHSKGFKISHTEQVAPGFNLRAGELDSLEFYKSQHQWWASWFDQWEKYLLPRAELAEKYGADMLSVLLGAEDTFRPSAFPEYGNRWRAIIDSVRLRYSGIIAIDVYGTTDLDFADAIDVLRIGVFPGMYLGMGIISDTHNPTVQEIRQITETFFDWFETDVGSKVPVYFAFQANSSDAQVESEPPPPVTDIDYGEQVVYYEGFLEALEDESWVSGLFSQRWDWFDGLDHPGIFFDSMTGNSPRNKPVEQLIKLWYGIY